MRIRMVSAVLFAIYLTITSIANGAENRDGNWWNPLPEGQKLGYAIGFLDGQSYANLMFVGAALYGMADPKTGRFDTSRARTAKAIGQYALDESKRDFGNVTSGQLAEGLDKIYADYRNLRIDVTDAMIVVVRSINGLSDNDIEKLLERKRHNASK